MSVYCRFVEHDPGVFICATCGKRYLTTPGADPRRMRKKCLGILRGREPNELQERRHLAATIPDYDIDLSPIGYYVVTRWDAWPRDRHEYINQHESLVLRRLADRWELSVTFRPPLVPVALQATYTAPVTDETYPDVIPLARVSGDDALPATIDAERQPIPDPPY